VSNTTVVNKRKSDFDVYMNHEPKPRRCESNLCFDNECQGVQNEEPHCRLCGHTLLSWFNIPCCQEWFQYLAYKKKQSEEGPLMPKCKDCEADITWLKTKNGKNMPVNTESLVPGERPQDTIYDANAGHESHWSTCPSAEKFQKKKS